MWVASPLKAPSRHPGDTKTPYEQQSPSLRLPFSSDIRAQPREKETALGTRP